jgi:hypothetical protein
MTVMGLQNHARNQVTLLAVSASEDAQDTQNETTKFQIPGKKTYARRQPANHGG